MTIAAWPSTLAATCLLISMFRLIRSSDPVVANGIPSAPEAIVVERCQFADLESGRQDAGHREWVEHCPHEAVVPTENDE